MKACLVRAFAFGTLLISLSGSYEAASAQQPPGGDAGPQAPQDDKVVDAEFEEVDDKKKKSA